MPLFSGNVFLPKNCGIVRERAVACPTLSVVQKFLAASTVAHQQSTLSRVLQEEIRQFEANFSLALEFLAASTVGESADC